MFALGKLTFGSGISSPSKSLREPRQDCQREGERDEQQTITHTYMLWVKFVTVTYVITGRRSDIKLYVYYIAWYR